MSSTTPHNTTVKPPGGVLPITVAATQAAQANNHRGDTTTKNVPARLKVIVRRLAPGLLQEEFVNAIGEEWILGKGKVDWLQYKQGKVTKE